MRLDQVEPGTKVTITGCPEIGIVTLVKVWAGCCRVRYGGGAQKVVEIPETPNKPARTFVATDYGSGTEFSRATPVEVVQ